MQKSISTENQQEQNAQQQSKPIVQAQQTGLVNTMFGPKPPIQTKAGRKGPIQAKQSPVQRHKNKANSNDLKSVMGNQYGVDLSGYTEHQDSSFPGQVGAQATIQGKDIHYAPGQFTLQNRKHELGHAIDNTINGTPKGDMKVSGHQVDTTREAAADKIMNTPLQMKAEGGASQSTQASSASSNAPIQMIAYSQMPDLIEYIRRTYKLFRLHVDQDRIWDDIVNYARIKRVNFALMDKKQAAKLLEPYLSEYLHTREGAPSSTATIERLKGFLSDEAIAHLKSHPLDLAVYSDLLDEEGYMEEDEDGLTRADTMSLQTDVNGSTLQSHERQQGEGNKHLLRKIMASGRLAKGDFEKKMAKAEERLGPMGVHTKVVSLKKMDRADEKYGNRPNSALDIVRGSIYFPDIDSLVAAQPILDTVFPNIVKTYGSLGKDYTGYQDIKMLVRLDHGHIAEVQLQLQSMADAKYEQGGEEIYNILRLTFSNRQDADKPYQPKGKYKRNSLHQLTAIYDQLIAIGPRQYEPHLMFIDELRRKIDSDEGVFKQDVEPHKQLIKDISAIIYDRASAQVRAEKGPHTDALIDLRDGVRHGVLMQ